MLGSRHQAGPVAPAEALLHFPALPTTSGHAPRQWVAARSRPFLSPCTKLKSKWIKDLHIKPDTLKLIEKNVGKNIEHMGTGEKFLKRTPIVYVLR